LLCALATRPRVVAARPAPRRWLQSIATRVLQQGSCNKGLEADGWRSAVIMSILLAEDDVAGLHQVIIDTPPGVSRAELRDHESLVITVIWRVTALLTYRDHEVEHDHGRSRGVDHAACLP
jgi:hypothetical protein